MNRFVGMKSQKLVLILWGICLVFCLVVIVLFFTLILTQENLFYISLRGIINV